MNYNVLLKAAHNLSGTDLALAIFLLTCAIIGLGILSYIGTVALREHLKIRRERRERREARRRRREAARTFASH
jgi:hypothetical protein